MSGRLASFWRLGRAAGRGSALVETALVLPLLLLPPALGVVGVGRVVQAQMGVSAATREAARAASLADSPAEASARGLRRAQEVATGYALRNGSLDLQIEPGTLARGAPVRAAARYEVRMDDLPLLGWITFTVRSDHLERTDAYRSRWPSGGPG